MSEKDCGHHDDSKKKLYRIIFGAILSIIILILLSIFLVWVILRPTKPQFILQDATIYNFTFTSNPTTLSSSIQLTILSKNPNDRIGILYKRMDVVAFYQSQQITLPTMFPITYQGHGEDVIWSPFVSAAGVPIAPYTGMYLNEHQSSGLLLLNIMIKGRVQWKVGTWMSGTYHIYVSCPAYFRGSNEMTVTKFQLTQVCHVDVGLGSDD